MKMNIALAFVIVLPYLSHLMWSNPCQTKIVLKLQMTNMKLLTQFQLWLPRVQNDVNLSNRC